MELIKVEEKVLYRYEDSYQFSDCGYRKPYLHKFKIIRETEKCYYIYRFLDNDKRVLKTGKNIFAWDTEEKALFNYLKRKEVHVSILRNKLRIIERNLHFAREEMEKREQWAKDNPTTVILVKQN